MANAIIRLPKVIIYYQVTLHHTIDHHQKVPAGINMLMYPAAVTIMKLRKKLRGLSMKTAFQVKVLSESFFAERQGTGAMLMLIY